VIPGPFSFLGRPFPGDGPPASGRPIRRSALKQAVTFVSGPVSDNRDDMAKLKGSECETILKMAGGVFGDKGSLSHLGILTAE
jgi:hypothetical protein